MQWKYKKKKKKLRIGNTSDYLHDNASWTDNDARFFVAWKLQDQKEKATEWTNDGEDGANPNPNFFSISFESKKRRKNEKGNKGRELSAWKTIILMHIGPKLS